MTGSIIALGGAIIIPIGITLMRYQVITGDSDQFALTQILGAMTLMLSCYWHFHPSIIIINGYSLFICLHTLTRNHFYRKTNSSCNNSIKNREANQ